MQKQKYTIKEIIKLGVFLTLSIFAFLSYSYFTRAQVPDFVNYQGRLMDSSGNPITSATTIQFSLYNHPTNGSPSGTPGSAGPLLWTETYDGSNPNCQQIIPGTDGIFAQHLGDCVSFPSYLDFTQEYYLGVKIGSDNEATPRVPLSTHPYAFTSKRLHVEGGDLYITNTDASGNILINTAGGMQITGTAATFPGAVYNADYSANYTNRSLVDKEYVDKQLMWEIVNGGERIQPKNHSVKQIFVEENSNSYTQFKVVNTNDTDNLAGAIIELKGSGADYTNNMYIGKYGASFWIPELRDNGAVLTDKNLVIGTASATNEIHFVTGNSYSNLQPVVVADNEGFRYTSDLSATFVNRTLVDKEYVDSLVSTSSFWVPGTAGTFSMRSTGNTASGGDATGNYSVAMGYNTSASTYYAIAEGAGTNANGEGSHAEGRGSIAQGHASHAEGQQSVAGGYGSHAEGLFTQANGSGSHSEGTGTIAQNNYQFAGGMYNVGTANDTIMEVGIGTGTSNRMNAFEIYTDGSVLAPEFSIAEINARGNTSLTTKEYVDNAIAANANNIYNNDGTISEDRSVAGTGGHTVDFNMTDGLLDSGLTYNHTSSELYHQGGGAGSRVSVNVGDYITITDLLSNRGAVYAADYSANYTSRSLVDKEYVDNAIASGQPTFQDVVDRSIAVDGYVYADLGAGEIEDDGGMLAVKAHSGFDFDYGAESFLMFSLNGGMGNAGHAYIYDYRNTGSRKGLEYGADYSADFTNRSLVDKEYVDNQVASASPWFRDTTNGYIYQKFLTDRVGIGTATPDESLVVYDGNAKLSRDGVDPQLIFEGRDTGYNWVMGIDEEENIGPGFFYIGQGANVDDTNALLRLTENGNLFLDNTNQLHHGAQLSIMSNGNSNTDSMLFIGAASDSVYPQIALYRAKNNSTSESGVVANDILGQIGFIGKNSATTDYTASTFINAIATETWTNTAHGAALQFQTSLNGTDTPVRRLEIENDGTLNVAGTTDYELLVTDDDDIPNKAYVDTAIANNSPWTKNGTNLSPTTAGDDILLNAGETLSIADLTQGSIPFIGTGGLFSQDNDNFFWDDTNDRLGLGTSAPSSRLDVVGGNIQTDKALVARGTGTNGEAAHLVVDAEASTLHRLIETRNNNGIQFVVNGNNRVGIGVNNPNAPLHIRNTQSNTGVVMILQNTNGDYSSVFETATNPEGNVIGFRGDLAIDGLNGNIYIKNDNDNTNTGWVRLLEEGDLVDLWDTDSDTGIQVEESADEDMIRFDTAGTQRMRINNNGLLTYGTEKTDYDLAYFGTQHSVFTVVQEPTAMATFTGTKYGDDAEPGRIAFLKAGGSEGAETALQDGDEIAEFATGAYDGTRYMTTGGLIVKVDGSVSADNVPSKLEFLTNTGNNLGADVRMVLDHNGNLGIGDSVTPSSRLHIHSNSISSVALLTLENNFVDMQMFNTNTSPENSITGSIGDIAFDSANGEIYIKHSGNSTNTGWLRLLRQGDLASLWDTDSDTGIQVEESADEDMIRFDIGNASGTAHPDAMVINADGNVGIGTDQASEDLTIFGNSADLELESAGHNVGTHNIYFKHGNDSTTGRTLIRSTATGASSNSDLSFWTNSTSRFTITASGQVRSEVEHYLRRNARLGSAVNTGTKYLKFAPSEAKAAIFSVPAGSYGRADLRFTVGDNTVATEKTENDYSMIIARNGQVGIGDAITPNALLDVRGDAVFNDDGADADFRIEGDNDQNLFFIDAGNDRIGIGTNTPGYKMTIDDGALMLSSSSTPTASQDFAGIYTSSGELFAFDDSGNSTQISPHDENGKWWYNSTNVKTNTTLQIKMEDLTKDLNKLLGGGYVIENGILVDKGESVIENLQKTVLTDKELMTELRNTLKNIDFDELENSIEDNKSLISEINDSIKNIIDEMKQLWEKVIKNSDDIDELRKENDELKKELCKENDDYSWCDDKGDDSEADNEEQKNSGLTIEGASDKSEESDNSEGTTGTMTDKTTDKEQVAENQENSENDNENANN